MGINGTIADYETYGVTNTDYGLSVLYTDGRVAACGHNSGTGECGTKSNTTNDQWTLVDILF
jgi:hypothetical protein